VFNQKLLYEFHFAEKEKGAAVKMAGGAAPKVKYFWT